MGQATDVRMVPVPYSDLSVEQKLQNFWNAFCDCDFYEEGFPEEMEAAGFIEWRTATIEDVDACAFPEELGIAAGNPMWSLTEKGRAALSAARATGGTE